MKFLLFKKTILKQNDGLHIIVIGHHATCEPKTLSVCQEQWKSTEQNLKQMIEVTYKFIFIVLSKRFASLEKFVIMHMLSTSINQRQTLYQ